MTNEMQQTISKVEQVSDYVEIKMSNLENCSNAVESSELTRARIAMEKYMGSDEFIKSIEDTCDCHVDNKIKKGSLIFVEPANQFLNKKDVLHSKTQAVKQAQNTIKE